MKKDRVFSVFIAVSLTLLLGLALWFRVSSLSAIPEQNADESYEGLQVARMLQGEKYTLFTMNGNLLDPFFLAMQVPFQLASKPSIGVIRSAAALSGLLAILLTFGLGSRAFDRPTALIAAILLAVLPAAIVYGRIGHEYSQIPFFGVLAICLAMRANVFGLVLALIASFFVHPINVFLVPMVFPVVLVQLVRKYADNPVKQRRVLAAVGFVTTVAMAGLAMYLFSRPIVQTNVNERGPLDWGLFCKSLEVFLLYQYGLYSPIPATALAVQHWSFLGFCLVALTFGGVGLVRARQWERLAILLGLFASLAAFHIVGGPKRLIDPGTHRYGVVFIAPIVLGFASLIRAMFVRQDRGEEPASARQIGPIRTAGVVVVGFALLLCLRTNWLAPFTNPRRESLATVWNDDKDPYEQAITFSLRDHMQASGGTAAANEPCVVRGHGYWVNTPIQYLASWRKSVKVEQLFDIMEEFSRPPDVAVETWLAPKRLYVADRLRRGEYLVGFFGAKDPWARDDRVDGRRIIPRGPGRAHAPQERLQRHRADSLSSQARRPAGRGRRHGGARCYRPLTPRRGLKDQVGNNFPIAGPDSVCHWLCQCTMKTGTLAEPVAHGSEVGKLSPAHSLIERRTRRVFIKPSASVIQESRRSLAARPSGDEFRRDGQAPLPDRAGGGGDVLPVGLDQWGRLAIHPTFRRQDIEESQVEQVLVESLARPPILPLDHREHREPRIADDRYPLGAGVPDLAERLSHPSGPIDVGARCARLCDHERPVVSRVDQPQDVAQPRRGRGRSRPAGCRRDGGRSSGWSTGRNSPRARPSPPRASRAIRADPRRLRARSASHIVRGRGQPCRKRGRGGAAG